VTYEQTIATAIFLLPAAAALLGMFWGYQLAVHRYYLGDLNKYLNTKFPDVWTAYRRGVNEGYAQGLRDGQENPA
jgi:hypothetical protein